jgi:hypothetical protein
MDTKRKTLTFKENIMKKRLLSLLLIISLVSLCLASCGGGEAVYYGAVMQYDKSGALAVNIPSIGVCEIPSAKKTVSEFDGKKNNAYTLEAGDLVKITFKGADELAVMESYPARFNAEAEEILAYEKGIGLEYEIYPGRNPVCRLTCPIESMPAGANPSDLIAFCYGGNTDLTSAYCYGIVYTMHDGKITLEIELANGIEDFLSKYPDSFTLKIVK